MTTPEHVFLLPLERWGIPFSESHKFQRRILTVCVDLQCTSPLVPTIYWEVTSFTRSTWSSSWTEWVSGYHYIADERGPNRRDIGKLFGERLLFLPTCLSLPSTCFKFDSTNIVGRKRVVRVSYKKRDQKPSICHSPMKQPPSSTISCTVSPFLWHMPFASREREVQQNETKSKTSSFNLQEGAKNKGQEHFMILSKMKEILLMAEYMLKCRTTWQGILNCLANKQWKLEA